MFALNKNWYVSIENIEKYISNTSKNHDVVKMTQYKFEFAWSKLNKILFTLF